MAAVRGTPIKFSANTPAVVTEPVIDGDITDMINFVPAVINARIGTGVAVTSPAMDICKNNNLIVPCAAQITCPADANSKYFQNGYDLVGEVAAYDRVTRDLFLGIRVAGAIGDVDGDGSSSQGSNCPPGANIFDSPGIGPNETYIFEIHAGCSAAPTITVQVNNGVATADFGGGNVATIPSSQWKFVEGGHDLEVELTGVTLPPTWFAYFTTGAVRDGLSEDAVQANTPIPTLALQIAKTANPATICAGKSTVFTITVTNIGSAPGTVNLTDDLPAGFTFQGVAPDAGACPLTFTTATTLGSQHIVFDNVLMQPNEVRCVMITAQSPPDCFGAVENLATVSGTYAGSNCPNDVPQAVGPLQTRATVTCESEPCVTARCETSVHEASPGDHVTVSGIATNCSPGPIDVVITVAGGAHAFGRVAPGAEARFDTTLTMPACQDGDQESFAVSTFASNGCGQASANSSCPVTCRSKAPCTVTSTIQSSFNGTSIVGVGNNPAYVWFNSNFTVKSGTIAPGTQIRLRHSVVVINGTSYDIPDAVITFQSVSCASTSFDPLTKSWNTTVPAAGSDEIFLTGLVLPLLSLSGGATVSWSGSIESTTPGLCVSWKWGAAVYKSWPIVGGDPFAVDYDAAAIKPTHSAACGINNGDHAGTPQNPAVRSSVTGGARGGGGSNFTGSWSGTASACLVCAASEVSYSRGGGSRELQVTGGAGVGASPLELSDWSPNPFTTNTTLDYAVGESGERVTIAIFNVAGRLVRSLVDQVQPQGRYEVSWDARDQDGARVVRGVYFVRAFVGGRRSATAARILLLR
jgi:uncharacterized repeat protein (TIGR01451 family)